MTVNVTPSGSPTSFDWAIVVAKAAGWSDDRAAFDAVVTMMAAGLSPRQIAHEFFVAMKWIQ